MKAFLYQVGYYWLVWADDVETEIYRWDRHSLAGIQYSLRFLLLRCMMEGLHHARRMFFTSTRGLAEWFQNHPHQLQRPSTESFIERRLISKLTRMKERPMRARTFKDGLWRRKLGCDHVDLARDCECKVEWTRKWSQLQ